MRPLAVAAALALVAALLIARGTPLWWLGASLLVAAALTLWHGYRSTFSRLHAALHAPRVVLGRTLVPGALGLELAYVGVIVWIATMMMLDVFYGARPVSHDHTVHYVKAWQLHEHFLSRGRLHGYSQLWFAGYPVNYLYPIGTDLLVNLVYVLSFGLLSFSRAYGIAFWAFHVLTGYAGYRFGRAVFGPRHGPHVGLATGLLLITDLSSFRFGGWAYSIEYGVWPQALSLSLALLAVARVPALYEQRRLRDVGMFALYMGAAIVTHPIELIFLGMLLVASVLAALFSPEVKTLAGTLRLLLAYALSLLVAAAWLLPFWSTRDQTTAMGVWWDSTYELGKGLVSLTSFPGTLGYVLAFGMLGAVVMLRSRRFALALTVFMALLLPAVSSSTFIDELHLPSVSGALTKIQWLRMSTMVKPFWFAMAAYLLVSVLHKAAELAARAQAPATMLRDVLLGMTVSLLALPIAVPACQSFWASNVRKTLETERDRGFDPDRAALVQWLKRTLPRDGFYRLCVNTGHNHDLLDIATELDLPIYKRGFTPAENYIYKVNVEDPVIIEAVNVRYMIAKKPMPHDLYEQVTNFGVYRVLRFKRWNPRPFVVSRGQGEVKLERFTDEEIVLRAAPGSQGLLRLNVSYFPRWRAYRDGQRVPLWPTALSEAKSSTGFMTVALAPGLYRFRFERSPLDDLSVPLSLLGIVFALALVLADLRPSGLGWLRWPFHRITAASERVTAGSWPRLSAAALLFVLGASFAGFVALSSWTPKLALEQLDGLGVRAVRFDFLEELWSARVGINYRARERRCKRFGDRFVCRNEAGALDNEKYVASTPAEIEEYRSVRCIRARPEDGALLSIHYPRVPVGDAIVGYYGVERAGRLMRLTRPVDFTILVDGRPVFAGATTSDNRMHWFKADVGGAPRDVAVTFTVSARNVSKRFFCFYAQMADLAKGLPAAAPAPAQRLLESEDEPEQP